ncbi:hypothetical protein Psuf_002580 [Phytohabitans suffuscus]|uniref:Asp23/Gls24 family envelope stress response protein n=1 Tax=Phytohabitans suffuscus TaxID=624315 RepID=A0A6F8YA16_9ACTN|nr:hypothetical protein Psuf_002580 [Phytohabitans suffuscus]
MGEMDTTGTSGTATASRTQPGRSGGSAPTRSQLVTEEGKTRIAEGVVAKIAGLAAREIPGVHSMGSGISRRIGQLRSMIPGGVDASRQGVSVEVGRGRPPSTWTW